MSDEFYEMTDVGSKGLFKKVEKVEGLTKSSELLERLEKLEMEMHTFKQYIVKLCAENSRLEYILKTYSIDRKTGVS